MHFRYRLMAENPELLALYAEAYGEEAQEPAEPAYLNTRVHDAYIQGNDGRFRPEDSLSRAEAVAMLARLSVDGKEICFTVERLVPAAFPM